jgi:hypothetical protein
LVEPPPAYSAEIIVGATRSSDELSAKDLDFALCDAAEMLVLLIVTSEHIYELSQLLIAQGVRVREGVQEERQRWSWCKRLEITLRRPHRHAAHRSRHVGVRCLREPAARRVS